LGWDGKEGVIKHIIDLFNLDHGKGYKKRIKTVLVTIRELASKGILYKGQRIKGKGRKPHINSPQEYQILIDSMEQGYGLVTAIFQINEYREEESLPNVGLSTVCRTMNRIGPVIRRIKRIKQGKRDPTSPWARARQRWVTQLVVRLGEHTFDCRAANNDHLELTDTPSCFNPKVIPPLILHQLVFFDECYKKCEIGRPGETVYYFLRDAGGVYDSEGDAAKVDTKLHVKYAKEGRFSFGVAAVKMHDGTVEGRRCRTFDYSTKNLITITGEEKMIRDEIKRVKTLATGGQWVEKRQRLPGQLYENDNITEMDNIAETIRAKFEKHGITTVLGMKMITSTTISAIMEDKGFRVSETTVEKWKHAAEQAHKGSMP
jgi:hypothetical protein